MHLYSFMDDLALLLHKLSTLNMLNCPLDGKQTLKVLSIIMLVQLMVMEELIVDTSG